MENNLKPCPFCGGTSHIEIDDIQEPEMFWHYSPRCDDYGFWVICFGLCIIPKKMLLKPWNTRYERTTPSDELLCRHCGYSIVYQDGDDVYTWDYCPHCGARIVD